MNDKSYTVQELDALRRAVEARWLFGTCAPPGSGWRMSRQYQGAEKDKAVEELVRTHMLAGHTAQDLENEDLPKFRPPAAA